MASVVDYCVFLNDFVLGDRRVCERQDLFIETPWDKRKTKSHPNFPVCNIVDPRIVWRFNPKQLQTTNDALLVFRKRALDGAEATLLTLLASLVSFSKPRQHHIKHRKELRIGVSLKLIRESLRLTQSDIAHEVSVARAVIAGWEAGDHLPTKTRLYRWCQALGLVCPPKTALVRVVDFSPELLRFLQEDPSRL
jgi:DNA-binding XRE family transcriptional regulator